MNRSRSILQMVLFPAALLVFSSLSGWGDDRRDPFWPAGYIPRGIRAQPLEPVEETPADEEALGLSALPPDLEGYVRQHVSVGGFMRKGDRYVAFINGQVANSGEFIRLNIRGRYFHFKVGKISGKRVELSFVSNNKNEPTTQ